MKTLSKLILGIGFATTLALTACSGQYYVTEQPAEPYYVRPVAPYAGAYWVPGEWTWSGGRYVYMRGYYVRSRPGRVYVQGHWDRGPRGYAWRRGHWR
ncbi:hypothetical protein [Mucilaginibacter sp. KACC 22063]|uniref:hypothetical protein n=1 Tax=Mucilaginibacter sp. KACC 22063 TaxID=3025666 RepID=UPI002366B826|nr:hypothetical protein [Mucilaginibacter sp. KACC 22063]WDF53412.1 hypothetical protein PQ461_10685 [Mucilaginibacter sp. KACC 22063]